MALGKRKRRDEISSGDDSTNTSADDTVADLQARFREHFEARFKPLEDISLPSAKLQQDVSPIEDDGSDWSGLSEFEDLEGPPVIQYVSHSEESEIPKDELRSFMAWTPVPVTLAVANMT